MADRNVAPRARWRNDLTDQRFKRLVARSSFVRDGELYWRCDCDCGREAEVKAAHLVYGRRGSCGCLVTEAAIRAGHGKRTHGEGSPGKESPEYRVWRHMRQRCSNPKNNSFKDYGGRNIAVCKRWSRFENFLADMGRRPTQLHTIERRDNDGNYAPDNCLWATQEQQQLNKRTTLWLTYKERRMPLTEWARELNVKVVTLSARLRKGWSVEKALSTPVRKWGQASLGVRVGTPSPLL